MIWDSEISFDGLIKKWRAWYDRFNKKSACIIPDPPIEAQYALDLIFKTLIDDKENYPYLTTMSESTEQTNSIMLDLILTKYSRKYRKYMRKMKKENMLRERAEIRCGVYNRDAVNTEGNIKETRHNS